jgi:hypothetical protein
LHSARFSDQPSWKARLMAIPTERAPSHPKRTAILDLLACRNLLREGCGPAHLYDDGGAMFRTVKVVVMASVDRLQS